MQQLSNIEIPLGYTKSVSSENLNAAPASLQYAYSFIAQDSAISSFWVRVGSTVAGTDGNIRVTFNLYADNGSGVLTGSPLATYEQVGGWTAKTQKRITPGWTAVTLTIGARYWIGVQNTAASPATDYISFGYVQSPIYPQFSSIYNQVVSPWIRRTYNGTDWKTTVLASGTAITVVFNNGILDGPLGNQSISYDSNWLISSTRACGAEFKIPENSAPLNIAWAGLGLLLPPSTPLYAYRNRALVAQSQYSSESITSSRIIHLPLEFTAYPGDWIAIMTGAVVSSSGQVAGVVMTNDVGLLSQKQWGCRNIKLESGVWTVNELYVPQLTIYLHPTQPFAALPINRRKFNSMR